MCVEPKAHFAGALPDPCVVVLGRIEDKLEASASVTAWILGSGLALRSRIPEKQDDARATDTL